MEVEATAPPAMKLPDPPLAPEMQEIDDHSGKRLYWDRSHYESPAAQMKALTKSCTLYVGNLAFSTRSHHIRAHFEPLGVVKRVVMGLDRVKKTPCGFCFVEYYQRNSALKAVGLLSGTKLDQSIIRVELDAGFQKGREFGRGIRGGQVRDDRRGGSDNNRKRSRSAAPTVRLDAALPSSRSAGGNYYGPEKTGDADDRMEVDGPDSKRHKTQD